LRNADAVENTSPLKVGLVQINNSFSGQNYLPYAVGLLQVTCSGTARIPNVMVSIAGLFAHSVKQAVDHLWALMSSAFLRMCGTSGFRSKLHGRLSSCGRKH